MGKGQKRRPCLVPKDTYESNWERTFGGNRQGCDFMAGCQCPHCLKLQETLTDQVTNACDCTHCKSLGTHGQR